MSGGRILFIDAYDSFSNNIIALLKSRLSVLVEVIHIDDPRFVLNDDAFHNFLHDFDAVVAGPGPGHPGISSDVGLIRKLWCLPEKHLLPVFGICLGFQSMCLAFGAVVVRLKEPRHGMVTTVLHCANDVFEGAADVRATQYHSLHVVLSMSSDSGTQGLWAPSKTSPQLVPMAWDTSNERQGHVLMAARHCHQPYWGVQYHPESICTNEAGQNLIESWWTRACLWNAGHDRRTVDRQNRPVLKPKTSLQPSRFAHRQSRRRVHWRSMQMASTASVVDIADLFRTGTLENQPVVLDSGLRNNSPVNPETGSKSVIGLPHYDSIHFRYSSSRRELTLCTTRGIVTKCGADISNVFQVLESFTQQHRAFGGAVDVPFWGGLVGFISYEAGLESISVKPADFLQGHEDVWFVFVDRSIVVDHSNSTVYLQSIRAKDDAWLVSTERRLRTLVSRKQPKQGVRKNTEAVAAITYPPGEVEYCQKVRTCQDHLRAGSSYELCLTDTTLINSKIDPWQLYLKLREINPAPFGAYFAVTATGSNATASREALHFLSSSPERFLSWSRDGRCQFRPIKGTVKKSASVTREKAEEILNSPKERAENLMIVDLIRHDLNGVAKPSSVTVPKLMSVEEYESVFQLVSVIEGDAQGSGIDVLAASLPPGSMTGAPKKRSCELLQQIETGKPRGLYSGVFGYLDVGGGGDFSVVIRSAFKWDDEDWRIGAGGAVTALSDAQAEWEEMLAKRENVLRAFDQL